MKKITIQDDSQIKPLPTY